MALYTKSGSVYKGKTHKMKDGTIHTGAKHTAKSQRLYKRKPKKR